MPSKMERTSSVLRPSSCPKLTKPVRSTFLLPIEIAGSIFHIESRALGIEHAELNPAFGVGDNFLRSVGAYPETPIGSLEHRAPPRESGDA